MRAGEKACKHARVSEMTEEHYEPLWGDVPAVIYACLLCTHCGAIVRDWRPA